MPRDVPEWIGRNDNAMPPRSVFDRLWDKQGGKDAITGLPFDSKSKVIRDHIIPLADGGENREANLQLITEETHKAKTGEEAGERAKVRRNHERHRGYVRSAPKLSGPGFPKSPEQRKATTPLSDKFANLRRPQARLQRHEVE
jgi:5-methylcytosine-specific restriction endonuclease McrA